MNYEQAVEQAASALQRGEDANWQLARLTYENTRGEGRGDRGQAGKVPMAQWCDDVRTTSGRAFGLFTGKTYRRIWEVSLSSSHGSQKDWREAYDDARGSTVRERMEKTDARNIVEQASPETKRQVAQALMRDPAVIADRETADAIVETVAKSPAMTVRAMNRAADLRPAPAPIGKSMDELDYVAALGVGSKAKLDARRWLEDVTSLVAWVRANRDRLTETSVAAISADSDDLMEVSETARRCAAEIRLALGGDSSDSWLRSVLNEV